MTLREILNRQNNLAQATSTGLNSLKEYLHSVQTKMTKWVALADDSNESIAIAITTANDSNVKKMADVSRAVYQQCVDDPDGEPIVLSIGESVTESFQRSEILSSIEDVMSESSLQFEFLDYVMNNEQVKAAEFVSYIKAKYDAVTNNLLTKYSQYLNAGSPLGAVKGYLSSVNLASATNESNQYIKVLSREDFTGTSVWSIIWTDFTNKVSELFQGVWEGFSHLFNFFKNLFERIIELGKWLLTKIAKPLTTNYEKSGANFGILDLPILQYKLGTLNISTRGDNSITPSNTFSRLNRFAFLYHRNTQDLTVDGRATIYGQKYSDMDYYVVPEGNAEYGSGAYINTSRMYKHWAECLVEYLEDGTALVRPFDVTIPIPKEFQIVHDYVNLKPQVIDSLVLRLGVTENLEVYLQLFVSMPKSFYDSYNDATIAKSIQYALFGLMKMVKYSFPYYLYDKGGIADTFKLYENNVLTVYENCNDILSILVSTCLFTDLTSPEYNSDGPIDVVSHLPGFNYEDLLNNDNIIQVATSNLTYSLVASRFMTLVLMPLLLINSPDLNYTYDSLSKLELDAGIHGDGDDTSYGGKYTWSAVPPASTADIGLPYNWMTAYRPYCNSGLIEASMHYQTLQERADELEKYIIGAIIAVAAIIVTIKVAKFVKNRNVKLELAQGYVDNMAWSLPANPTSAQISEYVRARKKANTIRRHNSLLGIGTRADTTTSIFNTIDSIKDQLLATQGVGQEYSPTMSDIYKSIVG